VHRLMTSRSLPTILGAGALLLSAVVSGCGSDGSSMFKPGGSESFGTDGGGDDATFGDNNGGAGGSGAPTSSGSFVNEGGQPVFSDGGSRPKDCDPSCAAAAGTCSEGNCTITENTGSLDPATQGRLNGGGPADASFKWLYPYDRTVFAHGIVSPTLQFAGTADAMLVHITSTSLDYSGYFTAAQGALNISLSQAAWQAVTAAVLGTDTVKVDVTKSAGGNVAGPITESWTIAAR
jgi:hypothetical protein